VTGISTVAGVQLQQWSCWGGPNQQWYLRPTGDGSYEITSLNSALAMAVQSGSGNDGAPVIQSPYDGSSNEKWLLEPTSSGYYQLVAENSGKCLDVTGGPGATADGVPVQQWTCWGGTNQQWLLAPL